MSANTNLEQAIKEIAEQVFSENIERIESMRLATNTQIDAATQERINIYELLSRKPYMTRKEAAIYVDVSERSLVEWSNRLPEENPFPECYAGGNPRYKREEIDKWISRERGRSRLKNY